MDYKLVEILKHTTTECMYVCLQSYSVSQKNSVSVKLEAFSVTEMKSIGN